MPNKHNDPKRHHIPKLRYKLSNWSDYNRSLQLRGRLDLWLNDDVVEGWYHGERVFDGTGSTPVYTDPAIRICHELRVIFRLQLRQTQGFINSLFEMAALPLKCPDYTLLSKRLGQLKIKVPHYRKQLDPDDTPAAIAIDSTGLKRFGRDEWHQEKHRVSSKRSWRNMSMKRWSGTSLRLISSSHPKITCSTMRIKSMPNVVGRCWRLPRKAKCKKGG